MADENKDESAVRDGAYQGVRIESSDPLPAGVPSDVAAQRAVWEATQRIAALRGDAGAFIAAVDFTPADFADDDFTEEQVLDAFSHVRSVAGDRAEERFAGYVRAMASTPRRSVR